jgi:hypothetical protein
LQADGENAADAVDGRRFDAVLCHGVLGYLDDLARGSNSWGPSPPPSAHRVGRR